MGKEKNLLPSGINKEKGYTSTYYKNQDNSYIIELMRTPDNRCVIYVSDSAKSDDSKFYATAIEEAENMDDTAILGNRHVQKDIESMIRILNCVEG